MKNKVSADAAVARLEALCARSEQCSADCLAKMKRWGLSDSDAAAILRDLVRHRFVDDLRFARAYVRDKYLFARWGRRKIMSGLYAKRIPTPIIRQALDEIDIRQYAAVAFRLLAAKKKQLPVDLALFDVRRRLLAFGASRGFETSLILKILDSSKLWDDSTL